MGKLQFLREFASFFVRWNSFKKLLTYTVCFLDCEKTACIYYSLKHLLQGDGIQDEKKCSVIPFHWELM